MLNICKTIDCPYFSNEHRTSWGCQRYSSAYICHLINSNESLLKTSTPYALHCKEEEDYDIASLKAQNETYLVGDTRYLEDKSFKEAGILDHTNAPFRLIEDDESKAVKFFKFTAIGTETPIYYYYAAYSLDTAKNYVKDAVNSQFNLSAEEVEYYEKIPKDEFVFEADLTLQDSNALANLQAGKLN